MKNHPVCCTSKKNKCSIGPRSTCFVYDNMIHSFVKRERDRGKGEERGRRGGGEGEGVKT